MGTYAVEVQARNNNNDPDRDDAWSAHIRRVAATDGGLARLVANPGGKRNRYIRPLCSTKRDPSRRSASSRYSSTRSSSHLPNSPFWRASVQLAASTNR